jgi:6-phosphogluconolactonase
MAGNKSRRIGQHRVRVMDDIDDLDAAVAEHVIRSGEQAFSSRGGFRLVLSGGSSPSGLFAKLAEARFSTRLDWAQTQLYWADERMVPPASGESNFGTAQRAFMQALSMSSYVRIQGELGATEALTRLQQDLIDFAEPDQHWPALDLTLLGLGTDGHTASLFPGSSPARSDTPAQIVTANYGDRPAERISMTAPFFNTSREILFIVKGQGKADAVKASISADQDPVRWPVHRLHSRGGAIDWYLDPQAASKL